ncbi:MAG: hypothetical protein H6853_01135 [Rhodospirillales bacterium]|nr:hypothetical protein [Alphaproteobacteria bacterium]USO03917.1 MAG: hypothetical protein H6853_01135 [Rhodospirillales bacterium]
MRENPVDSSPDPEGQDDIDEMLPPVWNRTRVALAGIAAFVLLIILLSLFSCDPPKGSILYGVCGAFLEQNVAYPETIRHESVEQYPRATRINFTSIDAFGQYKMEMIECSFTQDDAGGLMIEKVFFNRREVDSDIIKKFNISIPSIIAAEPDLTLPPPAEDMLEGLY